MFRLCFFFVCQNPKILFSQNKILDFCLTQVLRKQNVCQTYVKHVGDISFTLAAGLYQVWISNWQLLDTGGTANSCFTYVANFTHMFCFMCHLCFNYIPFMFRLRSTYVLSYVWHMFHIRFTYVSFMFHICFYLRLDIVYVYVMPRPPSIETIPGAPLDQANICPKCRKAQRDHKRARFKLLFVSPMCWFSMIQPRARLLRMAFLITRCAAPWLRESRWRAWNYLRVVTKQPRDRHLRTGKRLWAILAILAHRPCVKLETTVAQSCWTVGF